MWEIIEGPVRVVARASHDRYRFMLGSRDVRHVLYVEVPSGLAACVSTLDEPFASIVGTHGRTVVERYLSDAEPPVRIEVNELHSDGWKPIYRELSEA